MGIKSDSMNPLRSLLSHSKHRVAPQYPADATIRHTPRPHSHTHSHGLPLHRRPSLPQTTRGGLLNSSISHLKIITYTSSVDPIHTEYHVHQQVYSSPASAAFVPHYRCPSLLMLTLIFPHASRKLQLK